MPNYIPDINYKDNLPTCSSQSFGNDFHYDELTKILYYVSDGYIIKVDKDGNQDTTFKTNQNAGILGNIYGVRLYNNKIYVWGSHFGYNYTNYGIIRLNIDGTNDTTFNVGTNYNDIYAITIRQFDGKIVIGGNFAKRITRLNTDGTNDSTFNGVTSGFNAVVLTLYMDQQDWIIAGGQFTSYNGVTCNRILYLDADGNYQIPFGTGANGQVRTIIQTKSNTFYIGGQFTSFNGVVCNGLIKLIDYVPTNFFSANFTDGSTYIFDLYYNTNKLYVVGQFSEYNGDTNKKGLICLDSNTGDVIDDYIFNLNSNYCNTVYYSSYRDIIIVSGYFTDIDGYSVNQITKLINSNNLKPFIVNTYEKNNSIIFDWNYFFEICDSWVIEKI